MVNELQSELMLQAGYYAFVMIIVIFGISMLLRGFFLCYVRVRLSFGKFILVKIRTALRDYYSVGRVEDGFLVYKCRGNMIRLNLDSNGMGIYRCIAVNWVDVDEEKNAIMKRDYDAVSGYDAKKYDNLYVRCLTKPTINSARDKIMLICIVIACLVGVAALLVSIQNYMVVKALPEVVKAAVKGTLTNMQGVIPAG